jgi:hypothetical protein
MIDLISLTPAATPAHLHFMQDPEFGDNLLGPLASLNVGNPVELGVGRANFRTAGPNLLAALTVGRRVRRWASSLWAQRSWRVRSNPLDLTGPAVEGRAARSPMASSFCAAAAMVVSIAATSPSQPWSLASWRRSMRLAWISSRRGIWAGSREVGDI